MRSPNPGSELYLQPRLDPRPKRRPPAKVHHNLIANLAGRTWALLCNVVFVPLYVRLMGVEGYALVGFYTTLLVVFSVAGLGLSSALTREMSRLVAVRSAPSEFQDTLRTMETAFWMPCLALLSVFVMVSPVIGQKWFVSTSYSSDTLTMVLRLMGMAIFAQLGVTLYEGALLGLERQVLSNVLRAGFGTAQGLGAVAVLLVADSVESFFAWQILISLAQLCTTRAMVGRYLKTTKIPAHFRLRILRRNWRYAASMLGLSIVGIVMTQTDRIVLSKTVPLAVLGYYTLAWTAARVPQSILAGPVRQAFFPRLTHHASRQEETQLASAYHYASQVVAVFTLPAMAILVAYPLECLTVWLGHSTPTSKAAWLLTLLALGMIPQVIGHMPYTLRLASGWPSLSLWINIVSALCSVPLTLALVFRFQAPGAAGAWIAISAANETAAILLMHRRILTKEGFRWLVADVVLPCTACIVPVGVSVLLVPREMLLSMPRYWLAIYLFAVGGLSMLCAVVAAPRLARDLRNRLRVGLYHVFDWRRSEVGPRGKGT